MFGALLSLDTIRKYAPIANLVILAVLVVLVIIALGMIGYRNSEEYTSNPLHIAGAKRNRALQEYSEYFDPKTLHAGEINMPYYITGQPTMEGLTGWNQPPQFNTNPVEVDSDNVRFASEWREQNRDRIGGGGLNDDELFTELYRGL